MKENKPKITKSEREVGYIIDQMIANNEPKKDIEDYIKYKGYTIDSLYFAEKLKNYNSK